jgi:hypothetical protein
MRKGIVKKGLLIIAGLVLFNGCLPGIMITQKEATVQGQTVEFRLGNRMEVGEWVALQKKVCADLDYATETLPADVKEDIYKYSCVEPDRHALGETLSKLQPGQIDEICARLSQKGYIAAQDKVPPVAGEMGAGFLMLILLIAMM